MIRYVRIGAAITEGTDQIALFDTVTDRFLVLGGSCVFDDVDHVEEAMERERISPALRDRIRRVVEGGRETEAPRPAPDYAKLLRDTPPEEHAARLEGRRPDWLDRSRTRGGDE